MNNKLVGAAVLGSIAYFLFTSGATAKKEDNSSDNNTQDKPTDTAHTHICAQGHYKVNGKKVCEDKLSNMGFIWIKHPAIVDGWYHHSQFNNNFSKSTTDHLAWLKLRSNSTNVIYRREIEFYFIKGSKPLKAV